MNQPIGHTGLMPGDELPCELDEVLHTEYHSNDGKLWVWWVNND